MTESTFAVSEIVGTSSTSVSDAVQNGLNTAVRSLRNLEWFEVTSIRGRIENNRTAHFQVTIKLGFRYEASSDVPLERFKGPIP